MWVITGVAGFIAIIILLLCIPLDMTFRFEVHGRAEFSMRLSWFLGLVRKEMGKGGKEPAEKEEVSPAIIKRRKPGIGARTIFNILRTRGLLRRLLRLIKNILARLSIRALRANFRVGLDNAADTGLLFAVIGPVIFFLSPPWCDQVRVEPCFEERAVLEGDITGTVRLQPIRMAPPVMSFIFSRPAVKAMKVLVAGKLGKKK